ncbi:hypothetical protein OAT67_08760 [Bacteriovoracaceae bacterium]|nr:hypothetical protein [Bacteriovoracaceae bacterium]
MKKILLTTLLVLSVQLQAAGGGKLIDLFLTQSGLETLFLKTGIEDAAAQRVTRYISNSILSFSTSSDIPSKSKLVEILKSIKGNKRDTLYQKKLLQLLNKNSDNVTKEELVDSVNSLIYLANRYGVKNATILACADCVSETLGRHGFKFTFEEMTDTSTKQLLESYVPRKPDQLNYFITKKMKELELGDYSRVSRKLVRPSQERTLALFLALAEESSPASSKQRELINAILEFSKDSKGKVQLISKDNQHILYGLVDDDSMTDAIRTEWIRVLEEASNDPSAASKKEAFFKVLRRDAGDSTELNDYVNSLELKKCFFRV